MIDKKGEKYFEYICISVFLHILSLCILSFRKWKECFKKFKQKGGEKFLEKEFWIYVFISHLVDACLVV